MATSRERRWSYAPRSEQRQVVSRLTWGPTPCAESGLGGFLGGVLVLVVVLVDVRVDVVLVEVVLFVLGDGPLDPGLVLLLGERRLVGGRCRLLGFLRLANHAGLGSNDHDHAATFHV